MTQNSANSNSNNDFTFKQYLIGLLKHWFLILVLVALAVGATLLYFMYKVPNYTSTASILLEDKTPILTTETSINPNVQRAGTAVSQRNVVNEVQHLKSLDIAQKVNNIVRFDNIKEFNQATKNSKVDKFKYFASKLKVSGVPDSNVINITYTATDAKLAAKIVNVITSVYIRQKSQEENLANGSASNWLGEKVRELQNKQRLLDAKIVDFRIKNGIFNGQNNQKLLSQQLTSLNNSIVTASSQRAEANARAAQINRLLSQNGNLDTARDVLNSRLIQQYRGQALTIQRQIATLSETLLPSHPRLQSINAELNNVNQQIRTEANNVMLSLRGEAEIAQQRERSLKAELNNLKRQEAGSLLNEVGLNSLLRDGASNRVLLDSYSTRFREADVRNKSNLQAPKVHVLSQAVVSLKQSGISRNNTFIIAAIAAFILGLTIASMRILNSNNPNPKADPGIRNNHDKPQKLNKVQPNVSKAAVSKVSVSKAAVSNGSKPQDVDPNAAVTKFKTDQQETEKTSPKGKTKKPSTLSKMEGESRLQDHENKKSGIAFRDLSFMAAIPSVDASKRQEHILKANILTNLNTEYAVGFVDLADNLMAQTGTGFQKHFMISGLDSSEESYEAIMNLGRILDHKGARVLVLDLDDENHIFPKSMVDKSNFGFSEILDGRCYFEDCLIKDSRSGLQFLLAGSNNKNLDHIISSKEMHQFLNELDNIYDVILIHSNDLSQRYITKFIEGEIDLTLLVADWEDRATEKLQKVLSELKKGKILDFGLLLLDADMQEYNEVVN